jgi:hypothetical protein
LTPGQNTLKSVHVTIHAHIFDEFMYLFACFTTCYTKEIQPPKLLYGGYNLLFLILVYSWNHKTINN